MKSVKRGGGDAKVRVTEIGTDGIRLLVDQEQFFLSFREFPWFRDALPQSIQKVELLSANHLYWPFLDVDLEVDCLRHPERYPVVFK